MNVTRLRVCAEADQRLIHLKARTGLTPNLLCRIGFCLSLNDPMVPDPDKYPADSQRELNRYTLMGEWDAIFVALLRERCAHDGLDLEHDLEDQFRAHVNRGVLMLYHRMKHLGDLDRLVQEQMRLLPTAGGGQA
ncbi:MAG: DNA sulfur modification protein DndE [Chloroflexaceae bacterium]|nr:DNA sulfur modification protein DndE [Chloroflexaceae bacterium]